MIDYANWDWIRIKSGKHGGVQRAPTATVQFKQELGGQKDKQEWTWDPAGVY